VDDTRVRTEAIEDFAVTLRELRTSVGNPSFREMSGRSGAISHTTLHEATKGNRLPSWETTVEFLKVCGADPAAYRERWERANLAVRSGSAGELSIRPDTSVDHLPGGVAEPLTVHLANGWSTGEIVGEVPAPGGQGRSRWIRPAAFAAAVVTVGSVAVIVATINRGATPDVQPGPALSGTSAMAALSPADCPVRSTSPPLAAPLHKGDAVTFIEDVTLPDCSRVGTGKTVTKTWRLKNSGTVPWKGYSLRRLDVTQQADQCQTISHVPIKDTQPGELVDIQTVVTTPSKPGLCYVRFKMVDASGTVLFPGSRPVNFQIIVDGL